MLRCPWNPVTEFQKCLLLNIGKITMVKLHMFDGSPPVRAVLMASEIFNVPLEKIEINILEQQHKTPEYLKKNPLHTVPTMEDGDFILHDSHAVLQYFADAYGKNDSWYPKDVKKRALVNQKLFFDSTILFPRLRNITYPAVMEGEKKPPQKKLDDIKEAYDFMEEFLSRSRFLAGDHMTIADVAAFASVSSLVCLIPLVAAKYPKTDAWYKTMEEQPFAKKGNAPGEKILQFWVKKFVDLK